MRSKALHLCVLHDFHCRHVAVSEMLTWRAQTHTFAHSMLLCNGAAVRSSYLEPDRSLHMRRKAAVTTPLGRLLIELRGKINQAELADLANVSQSTISRIESGQETNPTDGTL